MAKTYSSCCLNTVEVRSKNLADDSEDAIGWQLHSADRRARAVMGAFLWGDLNQDQ